MHCGDKVACIAKSPETPILAMLYHIATQLEFAGSRRNSQVRNCQFLVGAWLSRWLRFALLLFSGTASQWLCPARGVSPDLLWQTNMGSYIVQDSKSITFSP